MYKNEFARLCNVFCSYEMLNHHLIKILFELSLEATAVAVIRPFNLLRECSEFNGP